MFIPTLWIQAFGAQVRKKETGTYYLHEMLLLEMGLITLNVSASFS